MLSNEMVNGAIEINLPSTYMVSLYKYKTSYEWASVLCGTPLSNMQFACMRSTGRSLGLDKHGTVLQWASLSGYHLEIK
jgi:hypothetical protein